VLLLGKMEAHRERFLSKVEQTDGCWLWKAGKSTTGYGKFCIKHKLSIGAHRFSYCLHNNCLLESINGFVIRHSCHNPLCVNPLHLSTGTHQDNMDDKVAAGRQVKGINTRFCKLTEDKVRAIRVAEGSLSTIAAQYGVAVSTIGRIKSGEIWKHIL